MGSSCNDLALIDAGSIVFRGSPAELVEMAKGKVFEAELSPDTEAGLLERFETVSRTREGAITKIRAVAGDGNLPPGGRAVADPTLEEAYLAFMASRGRAEAATVEEDAS